MISLEVLGPHFIGINWLSPTAKFTICWLQVKNVLLQNAASKYIQSRIYDYIWIHMASTKWCVQESLGIYLFMPLHTEWPSYKKGSQVCGARVFSTCPKHLSTTKCFPLLTTFNLRVHANLYKMILQKLLKAVKATRLQNAGVQHQTCI